MAHRSSNRRRNAWAVSLLEVWPTDRVLETGRPPARLSRGLAAFDEPFGKMLAVNAMMFWHGPVETAVVCAVGR
jgi:hypothetical protein